MLQRTPGTSYVSTNHRGPAPLNTALGVDVENFSEIDPDPPMSQAQVLAVSALSEEQIHRIDEALLSVADVTWRKMAFVVAVAMDRAALESVPDLFFAERARNLVARGELESHGFSDRMRYCEVRRVRRVHT